MSEPFVGEIRMFAGNFAPRGWAFCDGQLLAVSQNDALFSLLGTIYGGDGRTTFGLPDMRGRIPVHQGSGPGLSPRRLGSKSGAETETLTVNQMPSHTHFFLADKNPADLISP
ncbi:MAG: phage tail protein, partial [Gammaproteobacteria bacterium]|nr:phage tail protein [Gammaproteobacteria bacterium]